MVVGDQGPRPGGFAPMDQTRMGFRPGVPFTQGKIVELFTITWTGHQLWIFNKKKKTILFHANFLFRRIFLFLRNDLDFSHINNHYHSVKYYCLSLVNLVFISL